MIRKISVIGVTLLLFGLGLFEVLIVNKINTKLYQDVLNLETLFDENKDNISNIYIEVTRIKEEWDNKEPNLCLMFNHKDLSLVTDSLSLIQAYVIINNYPDAFAQMHLLKEYAEKNDHVMGFNMQNLL